MRNLSTVGRSKAEMMQERIADINKDVKSFRFICFIRKRQLKNFSVINLIMSSMHQIQLAYKIHLIKECVARGVKIISSMGAANKMDPTRFQIADISKTHTDPWRK